MTRLFQAAAQRPGLGEHLAQVAQAHELPVGRLQRLDQDLPQGPGQEDQEQAGHAVGQEPGQALVGGEDRGGRPGPSFMPASSVNSRMRSAGNPPAPAGLRGCPGPWRPGPRCSRISLARSRRRVTRRTGPRNSRLSTRAMSRSHAVAEPIWRSSGRQNSRRGSGRVGAVDGDLVPGQLHLAVRAHLHRRQVGMPHEVRHEPGGRLVVDLLPARPPAPGCRGSSPPRCRPGSGPPPGRG